MQYELLQLPRTSSCRHQITLPMGYAMSSPNNKPITRKPMLQISTLLHSFFTAVWPPSTRHWLTVPYPLSLRPHSRKIIGTLFGNRRGHVSFAVQDDPRSAPVFLTQLAVTTTSLVREMSSGWVRISLESRKAHTNATQLIKETAWDTYCNGRKYGQALSRTCTELDWHVLSTLSSVGAGAGVIPLVDDRRKEKESEGQLMYMRARFERVVGSRDSEAFYMMSPEKNAGPEFSIFLLRI